MLEVRDLVRRFEGLLALDGINLTVEPGEIRCLIGPNGAGKTTLLNVLTGELRPSAGTVLFEGRRIDGLPVHRVARLGLVRKFQVPAVFGDLSVRDNLMVAIAGGVALPRLLRRWSADTEAVLDIVDETSLGDVLEARASHLSHGQVQWLEIAMALATRPRVLLLDEPTAGMSPAETRATVQLLRRFAREGGLTAVIVEHDLEFVRMIGDRITVLHKGRILTEGGVAEIEGHPEVRKVYLGAGD